MKNPTPSGLSAARHTLESAAVAALLVLLAALSGGCHKGEKTAPGAADAGGTPGATGGNPSAATAPAPAAGDLGPHISGQPDTRQGPFGGLAHARAIAVDDAGKVWIADFSHAAVRIFDANGGSFGGWGGVGEGAYAMKDPCGIAVHGDNVYVADTWRTGVERFSTAGEVRGKMAADLYGPHGIAVGSDGHVYIADSGNNRIVMCDADLANPKPVGKAGAGPEQFAGPMGIAVGPSGNVYVADVGNKRIQILDGQGRFKARWKVDGWNGNAEPYLDVDRDETVYISDSEGQAVTRLDHNGREIKRWKADADGKPFARPTGVAIDRKNRLLYVVNTDSSTVVRIPLEK